MQTTGLSSVIATNISELSPNLNQAWILIIILIITMIVSDIVNNAATAVIMAPISYEIAINFGYDVNAFLMVVAIGASVHFLHQLVINAIQLLWVLVITNLLITGGWASHWKY